MNAALSTETVRYASTRDATTSVGFGQALLQGLAPDGGLYVPTHWPQLQPADFQAGASLAEVAERLLSPFLGGDAMAHQLREIVHEAFNFPAPLVPLHADGSVSVLELFHGPTAAFKDFGARFLAATITRLRGSAPRPLTILVATSGDTGGAVAAAFHKRAGIEVGVLFPKGLVSPTQQRQLTCWGGNVRSFAVRGTFDDCQRLVKQAFIDPGMRAEADLSSANSINLGRLLPQAAYYAASSLEIWRQYGEPVSYVIPSGNLGNAAACIWARQAGMPIGRVVLAHNANRTVPEFLSSGDWRPRASVPTLASAMDVGNPSNMERLRALFPQVETLRNAVSADSVDDAQIRQRIREGYVRYGQVWCPHTATAAEVYERMRPPGRWVIVATAHPAKFAEIVAPLIGQAVEIPETLARLFARPTECTEIDAELPALRSALRRRTT